MAKKPTDAERIIAGEKILADFVAVNGEAPTREEYQKLVAGTNGPHDKFLLKHFGGYIKWLDSLGYARASFGHAREDSGNELWQRLSLRRSHPESLSDEDVRGIAAEMFFGMSLPQLQQRD